MDRQIKNGRRMPSVCGSPSARLPHGDGGQPLVALKARLSPAGLLETAWLGGLASGSCSLVVPPSAALRAPPSRWAGTWLLRVLCKRGAWPHSPWRGPSLAGPRCPVWDSILGLGNTCLVSCSRHFPFLGRGLWLRDSQSAGLLVLCGRGSLASSGPFPVP